LAVNRKSINFVLGYVNLIQKVMRKKVLILLSAVIFTACNRDAVETSRTDGTDTGTESVQLIIGVI
jgi:hypothetical protein